jgi:hypothetical protein
VELSTDQKGAIAEACVSAAAIKLGIGVFKPLTDGHRYDLIFDVAGRLARVQCKWAPLHNGVVIVRLYSSRRTASGLLKRVYTADEIDAIAAYCPDLDRCFYLPASRVDGRCHVSLRVAPSLNNQANGVSWADDFGFECLQSTGIGAVAQLGERRHGMAEARGSSPLGSIHIDRVLERLGPMRKILSGGRSSSRARPRGP